MTNVYPCDEHRSLLNPYFPFYRVVQIAEDCDYCEVEE